MAVLLGIVMLAAACGDGETIESAPATGPASETCTDAAGLARRLQPMVAYDYEPTESPAALASRNDVVLRAGTISSVSVVDDWVMLELDDVRLVSDQREGDQPLPTSIAMATNGAELGGELPTPAELAGVEVFAFAHAWPDAPGGLSVEIEGFWIACGSSGSPASVIVTPSGEPWAVESLDDLERAVSAPNAAPGEVTINAETGAGWELVAARPGFGQPHEVAIITAPQALERAFAAQWFEVTPDVSFESHVVIILAPAVSSSCPGIIFDGLEITTDRVFGRFEPAPPPGDGCNADANPISFMFLVDRAALPTQFRLSVEEEVLCGGCEFAELSVDLDDEAGVEALQWGGSALDLEVAGTAPPEGAYNVVRFGEDGGLLFSGENWTEEPTWFQGYEGSTPALIEGFVAACEGEQCEECEGSACQDLVPLGKVCSRPHESIPFVDQTFTIIFDGVDCIIEAADGRSTN